MQRQSSVVLNGLGMNIDSLSVVSGEFTRRFSPVNSQRMRLSSMNMAMCLRAHRAVYRFTFLSDPYNCGFSCLRPVIYSSSFNSFCLRPIGSGINFPCPNYIALDSSRLYSQITRSVSRDDVAPNGRIVGTNSFSSEGNITSSSKLGESKVTLSEKSATPSTSTTKDQNPSNKLMSKPEGQQEPRRSKQKSKKQKLATTTGKKDAPSGISKKCSLAKKIDLVKSETSSAEVEVSGC